jgi:hypothetical protein
MRNRVTLLVVRAYASISIVRHVAGREMSPLKRRSSTRTPCPRRYLPNYLQSSSTTPALQLHAMLLDIQHALQKLMLRIVMCLSLCCYAWGGWCVTATACPSAGNSSVPGNVLCTAAESVHC